MIATQLTATPAVSICLPGYNNTEKYHELHHVGGCRCTFDFHSHRKCTATRKGDLRWRLLLVRRVGFRQGAGRSRDDLRLYRWQDRKPDLQASLGGGTGHYEAVKITYNPAKVSYEVLLTAFWHSVDPTDGGGQFCDRGESYRTAVFVANEKQRGSAEASRNAVQKKLNKPIVSPILAATPFYAAEDYHQNYYEKNPIRYRYYRWGCGRNKKVEEVWGEHAYEGIPGHG